VLDTPGVAPGPTPLRPAQKQLRTRRTEPNSSYNPVTLLVSKHRCSRYKCRFPAYMRVSTYLGSSPGQEPRLAAIAPYGFIFRESVSRLPHNAPGNAIGKKMSRTTDWSCCNTTDAHMHTTRLMSHRGDEEENVLPSN